MKSAIFKFIYLFFVVIISIALICELYLVIDRRLSNQQVKKSKIVKNNIFTQQPKKEDDSEVMKTLWEIPWKKYRANAELDEIIGQQRVLIKINSHGYRTREFETKKQKGVYRIICIGSSTTFQGATNDNTYPAILEKKLMKRYPNKNIEVLNFGISGALTDHWISHLDDVFKFQPDMIVHYDAVNDITGRYLSRKDNKCTGRMKLSLMKALNISFLYQKIFPLDPSVMDECFKLTFNNFDRIASESEKRGIEYIVGTFAAPDYTKAEKITQYNLDYAVQRIWGKGLYLKYYSSYYNLLIRFNSNLRHHINQRNMNIALVDTHVTDPALFTDICHLTQQGIEIMAEAFYRDVIKVLDKKMFALNR